MNDINIFKKEIAYFMRRLYKQGLTTTSGGNLSVRISEDEILITPSQTDKGRMKASEIIRMKTDGTFENKPFKPSMECGFHLEIYKNRPDIQAIVHAHPVLATSFAVSHKPINCDLLGESRAILGTPVFASYALMGTKTLATNVAEAFKNSNVVLMENHGIITVGKSLLEAFDRMEVLENTARINILAELLGGAKTLNEANLRAIDDLLFSK
jgi:L-fuculose-phosphate aldolase